MQGFKSLTQKRENIFFIALVFLVCERICPLRPPEEVVGENAIPHKAYATGVGNEKSHCDYKRDPQTTSQSFGDAFLHITRHVLTVIRIVAR